MTALDDFQRGFADGWHGRPRRKNQSAFYRRAYRKGVEGRERDSNGGEDTRPIRLAS